MTTALPASVKLPATPPVPSVQPANLPGPAASPPEDGALPFFDALNIVEQAQAGAAPDTSAPAEQRPAQDAKEDGDDAGNTLPGMSMLMPPPMMGIPLPVMQLPSDASAPDGAAPGAAENAPGVAPAVTAAVSSGAAAAKADAGIPKAAATGLLAAIAADGGSTIPPRQQTHAPLPAGIALAADALPAVPARQSTPADMANITSAPRSDDSLRGTQPLLGDNANPGADRDPKMATAADLSPRTAALSSILQQAARADTFQVSAGKSVAAPATQAQQPLAEALGERIRVQLGQRIEHAVIRLDPPMMGTIEVVVRHEAGALQVQLSASHNEVLRQLQNISDSLRQDLVHRQYTDVSVLVSNGMRDGDGRQQPRHTVPIFEEPGLALAEAGQESSTFSLSRDRD